MRFFLPITLLIIVFFSACGYRPSSKFARDIIGQKVSTAVKISSKNPENSVIMKDAVDKAILMTFNTALVNRTKSDTHLLFSISSPIYTPIKFDSDGFVVAYKMTIYLDIVRYFHGKSKLYQTKGIYEFPITPNAILTDQERFEAIKSGAQKAINSFIAQLSSDGKMINKGK